jgi:DNA invertase Pin-like site-specific DNA recombinase
LSFVIIEAENFLRRKEGVIKALHNRGFDVEEGGHAATRMIGRNISVETVQRVYNEPKAKKEKFDQKKH